MIIKKRKEIEKMQLKKLQTTLECAYKTPFYHRKFKETGIKPDQIETLDDLQRVPTTKKFELIEDQLRNPPFGSGLTVSPDEIRRIYVSPGPIIHPYTQNDIESHAERLKEFYTAVGVTKNDIVNIAVSFYYVPAGYFHADAIEKIGAKMIPGGTGETLYQIEMMKILNATVLIGNPSFALHLADKAKNELNIDPTTDLSLRLGLFGAEPFPPEMKEEIGQLFDLIPYERFGIAEAGVMAHECVERNGLHFAEGNLIIEMIDPETGEYVEPGEVGELVFTTLDYEAFPKIRQRSGDAIITSKETCACGSEAIRMIKYVKRLDKVVRVKALFVYPQIVENVVKRYPEFGNYQLIIDRPKRTDRLTVKIELIEPSSVSMAILKQRIEQEFKDALRLKTEIEFVPYGTIISSGEVIDLRK